MIFKALYAIFWENFMKLPPLLEKNEEITPLLFEITRNYPPPVGSWLWGLKRTPLGKRFQNAPPHKRSSDTPVCVILGFLKRILIKRSLTAPCHYDFHNRPGPWRSLAGHSLFYGKVVCMMAHYWGHSRPFITHSSIKYRA